MIKLIFRSNINLNSACLQKEEHVLGRASCTNRQDAFMQTNMDVIWCDCKVGSSNHSWKKVDIFKPHGIDSRTKEKEAGKRKQEKRRKTKERRTKERRREKNINIYEVLWSYVDWKWIDTFFTRLFKVPTLKGTFWNPLNAGIVYSAFLMWSKMLPLVFRRQW